MRAGLSKGVWTALLLAAMSVGTVTAQSDKDAEQLKRLRLQMRQLQQQSQASQEAQAQAEQARLKAERSLSSQSADLERERSAAGSASRRAGALQKELTELKAAHQQALATLASTDEQLKALQQSSRLAQQQAQDTQGQLRSRGEQLASDLGRCTTHNAELVVLGKELWQRYEDKGIAEVMGAAEPFVQTARVRLENLQAEYARRISQASMPATAAGTPP